jgi:hypothetical protein
MTQWRSCSWCHTLNWEACTFCLNCGHEAFATMAECRCFRCSRFQPDGITHPDLKTALDELRGEIGGGE